MKFSIWLPTGVLHDFSAYADPVQAYEALAEVAYAADETTYDTGWTADHFEPYPATPDFVFESWTTLAALARDTNRVCIGQMVTGNGYRNPALQAKMASTLDVLSHGRFRFGIGAGNYEDEYRDYGYEFPDGAQRVHELREAVQIILSMWTNTETTFQGDFYQLRHALNDPKRGPETPRAVVDRRRRRKRHVETGRGVWRRVQRRDITERTRPQVRPPEGALCARRPRLQPRSRLPPCRTASSATATKKRGRQYQPGHQYFFQEASVHTG